MVTWNTKVSESQNRTLHFLYNLKMGIQKSSDIYMSYKSIQTSNKKLKKKCFESGHCITRSLLVLRGLDWAV